MGAVAGLGQLELRAPRDHLFAELDERLDEVAQRQRLGPAAADGEHVCGEARLGRRVAPELVQHYLRRGIALEVDDHAHALAVGFVANVGNALHALVLRGLGDLLHQPVLADLIRNGGEHDRAAVAPAFLDLVAGAHNDRALAGQIGAARAGRAEDQGPRREIGGGDIVHQPFRGDGGIIHIGFAGGDDLAEIVRRDIGRHADRDAAGAVDQQIGEAGGQDLRLHQRAVIIGREVDRVLVEILEQGHRDLREARLGIALRRGRIGVHRTEIALAVDQRHAHRPVLGHPGQGVVDREIAVRMVVAHRVADDLRGLAVGPSGDEAALLTGVEDAPVHRLQPVAHVGQCTRDDHRHGVVEIGGLHLLDDGDGGNVAGLDGRRCAGQWCFLDCCRCEKAQTAPVKRDPRRWRWP